MSKDTIAAISTAALPAGIAIVRLSGSESIEITEKVFKSKKPLREASSHTIHFGHIVENGEIVDEVLVTLMKSPKTYTGEDVVEINCHGSLFVQRKILNLIVNNGARLAGPGEFTMRAFLNGRIDLSRAEAVMDVISSENETALKASLSNLSGNFAAIITDIREKIIYQIAYIESALDDPEHISLDGFSKNLETIILDCTDKIDNLIENASTSEIIKNGIDCAIIGGVNVGKSSILNALSGEDKAIVTDIPGTTRDIIEQRISLGEFTLNIIDTAGIRESKDEVEKIGILRSKELLSNCSLILYVLDGSKNISKEDFENINILENKESIIIINKDDLDLAIDIEELKNKTNKPILSISAKNYKGFGDLKEEIRKIFFRGNLKADSELILVNERHVNLLRESKNSLELVKQAIDDGMTEEIFAVDLTDAYESLGKILGKDLGEDVINEIFSKFCVGK